MTSSNWQEQRSHPRFVTKQPVYVRTVHEGNEFQMLIENLSLGGASLMCPSIYGLLQNGQCLRSAELVLSNGNTPRMSLIIRWQLWPRLGVEFDNLSPDAAWQISELLETLNSATPEAVTE